MQQLRDQSTDLFIEQDFERMQLVLQDLVNRNDPWGMHYFAGTLSKGIGVEVNQEKANELYLRAANLGFADSQAILGHILCAGNGCTKDIPAGIAWLQKASEQGHDYADFLLSEIYITGIGVQKNTELGVKHLKRSAENNYPEAQRVLGGLKLVGELTEKDISEGLALLQSASNQSNNEATYEIGKLYETGSYVAKDMALAAQYLELAANNGHVRAMHDIGVFYYNGTGVGRDVSIANTWYLKAVNQGSYLSAYCLGLNSERGEIKQQHPAIPLAIVWYLIAISQSDGSDPAPENKIRNLRPNLNDSDLESILYIMKSMADELKFPWAQLALGDMYLRGDFVTAKKVTAMEYFTSAAAYGVEAAEKRLRSLTPH
jgi:TPR repeat protein